MTTLTQDRELLEQALEDLCSTFGSTNIGKKNRTIAALRARLAQPDATGEEGGEVIEYCKRCHGEGVIHTGIDEAPVTQCQKCEGSGNAAPKSGDMAQDEQQWKYVVDALVAGGFVNQEKVEQAIAIYRTVVVHPAASTGAGQISDAPAMMLLKPPEFKIVNNTPFKISTSFSGPATLYIDYEDSAQPKGDGNG